MPSNGGVQMSDSDKVDAEEEEAETTETEPEDDVLLGELLVKKGFASADDLTLAIQDQQLDSSRRIGEILVQHGAIEHKDIVDALAAQQEVRVEAVGRKTVRVNNSTIDSLTKLASEMSELQSQLPENDEAHQRLSAMIKALQDELLQTRLQPIGSILKKIPAEVRSLASGFGKRVNVAVEGGGIQFDKDVVFSVREPLRRLVQDCVEGRIESPDLRRAAGKDPEAQIVIRAGMEDGTKFVELNDDGNGSDPRNDDYFRSALEELASATHPFGGQVFVDTELGVRTTVRINFSA